MYLIYQFTTIVEQSVKFAELAGYTSRIGQMLDKIDAQEKITHGTEVDHVYVPDQKPPPASSSEKTATVQGGIHFANVTLSSPTGKMLVNGLELRVPLGENLLITGANGTGKTSLLRVLCGLWPVSAGECSVYGQLYRQQIHLLPQVPYLTAGSLRDQIAYPAASDTVSDEELTQALSAAGIGYLATSVVSSDTDYGAEWSRMLSPGEAQRLAFARLLHSRPALAVLDEATSAVDEDTEGALYTRAIQQGITLVSIGHRASLRQFHQRELHLNGGQEGDYTLMPVEQKA
jgi:ATP-binding cassette subfamily D (ALD) protein 4